MYKKGDARAELLFCSLNPLLFWRSPRRRCRSFVRSLLYSLDGQRSLPFYLLKTNPFGCTCTYYSLSVSDLCNDSKDFFFFKHDFAMFSLFIEKHFFQAHN